MFSNISTVLCLKFFTFGYKTKSRRVLFFIMFQLNNNFFVENIDNQQYFLLLKIFKIKSLTIE